MARTRTVYPKEQIAHIWANAETRDLSEIRTSTGNLYTAPVWVSATKTRAGYGESAIWSYGRHYCLARHTVTRDGLRAVLFNANGYSVTTQRHRSITRAALPPSATVGGLFFVSNPGARDRGEHLANLDAMRDDYANAIKASERPRIRQATRDGHIAHAASILETANRYAHAFKLRPLKPQTAEQIAASEARVQRAIERARAEQARAEAARNAQALADSLERLAAWKRNEISTHALGYLSHGGPVHFRIKPGAGCVEGSRDIETSRGVIIAECDAARAWQVIKACKEQAREFIPSGLRTVAFGERYAVSRIAPDGTLTAGCHTVAFEQAAELAAALGLPV